MTARGLSAVIVLVLSSAGAGCGSRSVGVAGPAQAPNATVVPGECADPSRDGVLSDRPKLDRADLDLDNDGTKEWVSTDRTLCTAEGNCRWNVFSGTAPGGCRRYLGTIEARGIEPLDERGDHGYRDLRGWWSFGGGRFLLQHYRFKSGSYQVVDALVCRQQDDDRLLCAEDRK